MDDKVLFLTPPGAGLSEFIDRFTEEARGYPFETFCIVSTSRLKDEVIRRIHEKGIPILKDRICTLKEIAEFIFSEHLPDIERINDEESKLIISHIISTNKKSLPLFSDNRRNSIKFAQEIRRFISTLTQRRTDFPMCLAELQSEKSRQLAFINSSYLKFLSDDRIADDDLLLDKAAKCMNKIEKSMIKRIFMYGFFEPSPMEKELIVALDNSSKIFHYWMPYANNSKIFIDHGDWLPVTQRVSIESNGDCEKLSQLFGDTPKLELSKELFFARFKDRVSEIRAIAQQIRSLIAKGVDPSDIAVVLPDRDRAAMVISDVFPDFRIPYDIRGSSILSHAPIIQTIIDIMEIPAYNYKRESVVRLLKSPYIRLPSESVKDLRILGHIVDFESRKANIIEGRNGWKKLGSESEERNDGPDFDGDNKENGFPKKGDPGLNESVTEKKDICAEVGKLFDNLQKLEGDKPVKEHIAALFQVLCDLSFGLCEEYPREELRQMDAKARASFFEVMDCIERAYRRIPEAKMDLSDFLAMVQIGLSEKRFDRKEPNRNAVQLTGMREVTHLSYDYIFILDMVDGEMPRTSLSQPFFTGFEIERMGLLTNRDLLRQERYYFLAALQAAKKMLFLSCSSSDKDQPLVPSFFIRDISESYKIGSWGDGGTDCSTIKQQYDCGKSISNGGHDEAGLIGASLKDARSIAEKINIENYYRKNEYKSEYDGILKGDAEIASELSSKFSESKVYSPTMFESYGLCPFQFYLKYVLYLDSMPEIEEKMSSSELGVLFHRIAFRFYENRRKYGCPKVTVEDLAKAIEDIDNIAKEEFANEEIQKYSSDADPVWYSLKQRFIGNSRGRKGLLEDFVRREAEGLPSCFSPANFELSIGSTASKNLSDVCSRNDPVSLDLGPEEPDHVLIQGRIDRLDLTEDGQFMVIDYKTGSVNPGYRDIESGTSFQLPIYIRCIEASFPDMQGIAGAYYLIKSDGEMTKKIVLGDRKYIELFEPLDKSRGIKDDYQATISASLDTVKKYIQNMRKGIFHPTVLIGKCPRYCSYKTVCRLDDQRILESQESLGSLVSQEAI